MATIWTELPSEVLGYILEKIDERDLKTFLAASAVCRGWRCSSSWVSSIPFATYYRDCKKHHNYLSECSCFTDCIRSVLARSKSLSKLSIDLYRRYSGIDRSIVCDVLGKCNCLDTLQELHMGFGCTRELFQVLRSCSSLSVLSLDLGWIETEDVPKDLILASLKSLSVTNCISNEVIQLLMKPVANLEYLRLCYYEPGETFVINAPASVVRMELYLSVVKKLLVNAAGVKDMIIQATQVELEAPLLEDLKLHFGTQIIKGSPAVRRLYLCLTDDSSDYIVSTLSSCLALSGIKTLCISTDFTDWGYVEDTYIDNSRAFFEVMSKLKELEELELNFNTVIQISPQGHGVTMFLPKLKTLALDCSVCALDDDDDLAKREDSLLEKFRIAWEYLKSVTPRAQVVIRNEHLSSLTKKVDLLRRISRQSTLKNLK